MKTVSLIIFTVLLTASLGCKLGAMFGSGELSVPDKHFAVKFPGGSGEVETQPGKAKNKYVVTPGTVYTKNFDNHSDNFRSYEVTVFDLKADPPTDISSESTILALGLNGWYSEPETTTKEVTINGLHALDSVRTIALGPAKMTFREVVFWSDKEKLLYVVRIAATKKENTTTPESEDFINSFRLV